MGSETIKNDAPANARKEKLRELIRERRVTISNAASVADVDHTWLRNIVYRTDPLKVDVDTFMTLARVCGMNPVHLYKKLRFEDQNADESKKS